MNAPPGCLYATPELEFSYSQFFIYDAGLKSPACEWTEAHSRQGFSRRDGAAAVGTLLEFGKASVKLGFGTPAFQSYERALAVPLEIKSGAVAIDGPEETSGARRVSVENGYYRVTIAQKIEGDAREEIGIWLEKVELPVRRSELLIVDDALDPPSPLLETANTP